MSATEYSEIAALIAAHKARLHQLQMRQASQGTSTPVEVLIEIGHITAEIERHSGKPVEMTTRERYLVDQQWQMRWEVEMIELKREVRAMDATFRELLPHMAELAAFVVSLQQQRPSPQPQPRPRQTRRPNGE